MATKDGFEYRQLHIEDYLLMVSAEQGEQAEVYARQRIAGDDDAITDLSFLNFLIWEWHFHHLIGIISFMHCKCNA